MDHWCLSAVVALALQGTEYNLMMAEYEDWSANDNVVSCKPLIWIFCAFGDFICGNRGPTNYLLIYLVWFTFDNIHNCCEYIHQICISNIIAKHTISSKQFFHTRLERKTFSKLCKLKRGRRWKRSQLKRWAISLDESAPNALNWTQLLTTFSFENNEERENLARAPI